MHGVLHQLSDGVRKAHDRANLKANETKQKLQEHVNEFIKPCDLIIQFIGANGLPKMDVVGSADPYFVANIDDKISFTSTVQVNTLKPTWNERWNVNNVPSTASLEVQVYDKDEGTPADDYIGKFTTSVSPGTKECELSGTLGSLGRNRGTFWLKITSTPSKQPDARPYTFDGPIRYSIHKSPTVGRLTSLNDDRLYSTWKLHIRGVPLFFKDNFQHWNRNYKAAQTIFQGPASIAVRTSIQAGHRLLYARTINNGFGIIDSPKDTFLLLHGGKGTAPHRIKPAVYTYIIAADDDTFRFSETGAAFFVDFASKHALHSNCAESVRYSGEFHPRPEGGWENFNEETADESVRWELVIDNNSGTYSPDKLLLPTVEALLKYNFPGFQIIAMDHENPALSISREACRAYALQWRGVQKHELQPTCMEGEETLSHRASIKELPPPPAEPA